MTKAQETPRLIAENRKARFDYFIEERYEAGLALQGWEVEEMRTDEKRLPAAKVHVRLLGLPPAGAHRLALPALAREPRLVALLDEIVEARRPGAAQGG